MNGYVFVLSSVNKIVTCLGERGWVCRFFFCKVCLGLSFILCRVQMGKALSFVLCRVQVGNATSCPSSSLWMGIYVATR